MNMAESSPAQRIQFGDEINPIRKTSTAYSNAVKEPSLSEKAAGHDLEEKAIQIADQDLNQKKKQVRTSRSS